MNTLDEFRVGDRIEFHPATNLWMRGARYGTIANVGAKYLRVHVDKLNGHVHVIAENILQILE